jgi:hypothetical protein
MTSDALLDVLPHPNVKQTPTDNVTTKRFHPYQQFRSIVPFEECVVLSNKHVLGVRGNRIDPSVACSRRTLSGAVPGQRSLGFCPLSSCR